MARIFVTGHRNPDMDSVCSAYAYANLKNQIDGRNEYVPIRLGHVNQNVKDVFSFANAELPALVKDVKAKASDIAKSPDFTMTAEDPVYELISLYNSRHPSVVPIFDENGYRALVSVDDINRFFLMENHNGRPFYLIGLKNIPRVIPGFFFKEGSNDTYETQIVVGAMEYEVYKKRVETCRRKPILVVGSRLRHIRYAVENGFPGIILTGVEDPLSMDVDFSGYEGFVYVSREDTAETLRLLRLAMPISTIIPEKDVPAVQTDCLYDEVKDILSDSEYRGVSVFEAGEWKGFVTRRCFLKRPSAKLILMDHNEAEQSVIGIEEAEILEIMDHHRLAAPKMKNPILICSEPLGSTCTIVYEQYKKWGVSPDKRNATILLAGLLADTVMLKSPTATDYDRYVASRLASIAGLDLDGFARVVFSSQRQLSKEDPEKIIESDFKKYDEAGIDFGIGQVEVSSFIEINSLIDTYLGTLEEVRKHHGLDWAMLMVTDVFKDASLLLTTGFDKEYRFVYEKKADRVYDMPGVLSRKKQLLPEVIRILED